MSEEQGHMTESGSGSAYVVLSPVKDEESYVELTIHAMLRQSIRPLRWVIIDDGSRDGTPQILDRCVRGHPWIQVIRIERGAERLPGAGVMQAFAAGLKLVQDLTPDFIVKLDLDLDLSPDYFEQLIERFHKDAKLGIASGVYLEKRQDNWIRIKMPDYHAAGACKFMRTQCFKEMGGFVASRGWDTVDEIRAQCAGWKTKHFLGLEFRHLKKEGTGIGLLRTAFVGGQTDYMCGAGGLFFMLKVLHRMVFGEPFFLTGPMYLFGYAKLWLLRKPRLVTDDEAKHYRNLLNDRIRRSVETSLRRVLAWRGSKG